jgi:putative tryptophan/tyrosine transport system substrate-binding protein
MQSDHLRRRDFIALVGGAAAAWPVSARAQQPPARIGFLGSTSAARFGSRIEAFRSGLRDLGYVEGKTIVIAFRWADEKYDQLPALAAELVRENVDVIVTHGTPGTRAAKHATAAIPIVVLYIGDAVAAGVVASLRQPGGNVTGSSYFLPQLMSKRLELLKEAMPHIAQVAVLVNPDNPFFGLTLPALETAGSSLKIGLQRFDAHGPNDFEPAFLAMAKGGVDAAVIQEDAIFLSSARAIADLAARHSLPLAGSSEMAEAGGIIGYGADQLEMCRRAAVFVDKVLKGINPLDLPVEQADKFETVLNLRAAKTLGVTIPTSVLLRADRVIE